MTDHIKKEKSILKQTSLAMFIIILITLISAELIILNQSYKSLLQSLDKSLVAHTESVLSVIDIDEAGEVIVDFDDSIIREFIEDDNEAYFLIINVEKKSIIISSPTLQGRNIHIPETVFTERIHSPHFWEDTLEGNETRFCAITKTTFPDPDDYSEEVIQKHTRQLIIITGKGLRHLNEEFTQLLILTSSVLGAGLIFLLIMIRAILIYNLKPLKWFKKNVSLISENNLNPLPVPQVNEIKSVGETLNDVILRLRNAFDREKRFSSNVAHELRTPISEIKTLVEVVLKFTDDLSEEEKLIFADIFDSVIMMEIIVANLLILSRIDSNNFTTQGEEFNFVHLIEKICSRYTKYADTRGVLLKQLSIGNPVINADKEMLRIICENLISNAIEYSVEKSSIDINTHFSEDNFTLSIVNETEIITKEDIPLLFERFWRKDETRTSDNNHSGLGLALVKSLADYLKYDIEVKFEENIYFSISISGKSGG